jgi:hypothetical protein
MAVENKRELARNTSYIFMLKPLCDFCKCRTQVTTMKRDFNKIRNILLKFDESESNMIEIKAKDDDTNIP